MGTWALDPLVPFSLEPIVVPVKEHTPICTNTWDSGAAGWREVRFGTRLGPIEAAAFPSWALSLLISGQLVYPATCFHEINKYPCIYMYIHTDLFRWGLHASVGCFWNQLQGSKCTWGKQSMSIRFQGRGRLKEAYFFKSRVKKKRCSKAS